MIALDTCTVPTVNRRPSGASRRTVPAASAATASDTLATWSIPENEPATTTATEPGNGSIRWYDPVTGRWLSNDPVGINGGLNQYVFCGSDPVNNRDPSGFCSQVGKTPTALDRIRQHYRDAQRADGLWRKFFGRQDVKHEPTAFLNEQGKVITNSQAGNMAVGYTAYRSYGFFGAIGISILGEVGWPDPGDFWSGVRGSFEYNSLGIARGMIDEFEQSGRRLILKIGRFYIEYID